MSDKLMNLIGSKMVEFRNELLKSKVPNSLQEVVRKLIPPKGIRRITMEGTELLDYMEDDPSLDDLITDDDQPEASTDDTSSSDDEWR